MVVEDRHEDTSRWTEDQGATANADAVPTPPLQLHNEKNASGSILQQPSSGDSGNVMIG
jgi:hypothetical protein